MSIERAMSASTEIEVWSEPPQLHLVERHVGRHALFEGFEPLGEAISPFEAVRKSLEERIIDQPVAIGAIVEALERSEIRLPGDKRPIANLAFLGPTGVGKSETAKTLSEVLGGSGGNLLKIDCSDFSHGHEVIALTGAPVSYVGSNIPPVLNKDAVEKKGTVVLFDEVEKGSRELYNLMLQIMGDGELRLNDGSVSSFQDTIIILTSNLGAKEMSKLLSDTPFGLGIHAQREVSKDSLEATATRSFKKFFAPEFINRLNKMVVFHPLGVDSLNSILDLKLARANKEYQDRLGARLSLSDATKAHLVEVALQERHNGARPLERALESNVQAMFGRYVGAGYIQEGTHVRVFHQDEAPDTYKQLGDTPFIFTAKHDATIKKATPEAGLFMEPSALTPVRYEESDTNTQ